MDGAIEHNLDGANCAYIYVVEFVLLGQIAALAIAETRKVCQAVALPKAIRT